MKQFENRKIYFHKFWWCGVWHLSTNINVSYDWKKVKNILHKDLFVCFCTFLYESEIQFAFNSLSTYCGHTKFSHVLWCPTPYLCKFVYQAQFCTYESHCCIWKRLNLCSFLSDTLEKNYKVSCFKHWYYIGQYLLCDVHLVHRTFQKFSPFLSSGELLSVCWKSIHCSF